MNRATSLPPAVHAIDHFTLAVPDLDLARHFFSSFGLDVSDENLDLQQVLVLRAADSPHVWGRVVQGERKHMAYLTFNCAEQDYVALTQAIAERAAPARPHPQARYRDGTWLLDADGNLLQLRVGPKTVSPSPQMAAGGPAARGVVGGRSDAATVRPRRLSHVLLFASDVARQCRFYEEVLGLRLSDRSADIIAFMHAPSGSDHHLMAFAKSSSRGWHHCSWDVAGIEQVGLGWMQMQQAGYSKVWGPGRHVLGSNYFCYVEDPWGSFCEYSADIDYIAAGQPWQAGDHAPEDSLYLWGPALPASFIANTEAGDINTP
jgi:catechol 2,3-dioxygenase-like lactoylglutathione lyase family enzyme